MQKSATPNRQPTVVGVDVGGTKVLASLVDGMGGMLGRVYCPTDVESPEATLDVIARTVEKSIQESGVPREQVQAVGLGIPGIIDPVRGIGVASVNLNWRDVPVKAELEARLNLPCAIENDVKAAALGEARFGAGKGLENLVFLTIGTGIAAAIVLNNQVYRGPTGMAGEIGHAMIERNGPKCKCGGYGCFEALASGPAIAARAAQKLSSGRESLLAKGGSLSDRLSLPGRTAGHGDRTTGHETTGHDPETGRALTAEDVFHAAAKGDALALETAEEVGEYVAFAIQFLALAYDPRLVVLGGGVPQAGKPFLDPVLHNLERQVKQNWVFGKVYRPGFLQVSRLGSDIGVLGAAALVAPAA